MRNVVRLILVLLSISIGTLLTLQFRAALPGMADGSASGVVATMLFFLLTTWLTFWSGVAATGFALMLGADLRALPTNHRAPKHPALKNREGTGIHGIRTAILLPVYNEDVTLVFAGLHAMRKSLHATGCGQQFDFFVLSDSTSPDKWLAEELAWYQSENQLRSATDRDPFPRVYYRHRSENRGRKAGNIADFCQRWGDHYKYMVTLDADSLMEGATLVEMVVRMEVDPELGILQTAPLPLGQDSLFSRGQHFICRLCGPLLSRGFAHFSGDGGNYWGHNAIIRTAAFIDHCGLPKLPGERPLGGEILSHDFVEAALMRRAGYRVQLAWDLGGSYEQMPATLPEFLQRDQRWCQGNLQHTRIVFAQSIRAMNRFHFVTGILAYTCSPIWAAFVVLTASAIALTGNASVATTSGMGVLAAVAVLLLLPRLLALVAVGWRRSVVRGFGGYRRLVGSLILEFAMSVLAAPIFMAFHSVFVINTLLGRRVEWNSQQRTTQSVGWRDAARDNRWLVAVGVLATGWAWYVSPWLLVWLAPIVAGLILSAAFSVIVSSARLGRLIKRLGLLGTPEELAPPAIVVAFTDECTRLAELSKPTEFIDFLRDGTRVGNHIAILKSTSASSHLEPHLSAQAIEWIEQAADRPLATELQQHIMSDPAILQRLHTIATSADRETSCLPMADG